MSRELRVFSWLAILVGIGLILHFLNDVLLPFLVGMAIAYFFDPVVDRFEEWKIPRTVGTILILLVFFVIVFGGALLLIPVLKEQIVGLVRIVPQVIDRLRELLQPLLFELRADLSPDVFAQVREAASSYIGTVVNWATRVMARAWSGGVAFLNLLSLVLITPLVAFYLLRDYDLIVAKINHWLPQDAAPTIREQARLIDQSLAGFVRGQAMVCLVLGTYYSVALTLVGLSAGILVGILAGLLTVVPFVGVTISFMVSMGLAIAQFQQDWVPIALVAAVFISGQIAEGYFLTPKLVGERIGLSPIWIIFAMLSGGALFGFIGVLIALPVAAVAGVLSRFAVEQYLDSALYSGANEEEHKARNGAKPRQSDSDG